jgi:hypothetical protein
MLIESPPTPRRGFNGFCTSNVQMTFSGAKARKPLKQAQGGIKSTFQPRLCKEFQTGLAPIGG